MDTQKQTYFNWELICFSYKGIDWFQTVFINILFGLSPCWLFTARLIDSMMMLIATEKVVQHVTDIRVHCTVTPKYGKLLWDSQKLTCPYPSSRFNYVVNIGLSRGGIWNVLNNIVLHMGNHNREVTKFSLAKFSTQTKIGPNRI